MKIRRSAIALLLSFICLFTVLAFIGNGAILMRHSAPVTRSAAAPRNSISQTLLLTLTGEVAFDHFGRSVASAGDVNGDGFADVLIGADAHHDAQGRAYLYLGSSSGLSTVPALTLT